MGYLTRAPNKRRGWGLVGESSLKGGGGGGGEKLKKIKNGVGGS